jgi:hypothetical protein
MLMETSSNVPVCLNCKRSEAEAVLLSIRFRGTSGWICSQCFPTLIHNPAKLAGTLEGAETLRPAKDHD